MAARWALVPWVLLALTFCGLARGQEFHGRFIGYVPAHLRGQQVQEEIVEPQAAPAPSVS